MPAEGTLIVRVYTSAAQLPIQGAIVGVTQRTPNGTRLLATRITDRSGRIEPITIRTPNLADSLKPGMAKPWTSVDILIEEPSFERALIENVQIFAGIATQQNVDLIPLEIRPQVFNQTEVVDVTPQQL